MYLVLLLVFLLTVMIMLQIQYLITRKDRLIEHRFKIAINSNRSENSKGDQSKIAKKSFKQILGSLGSIGSISKSSYANSFQDKLTRAGIPLKPEEFVGLNVLSIIGGLFIGLVIVQKVFVAVILVILAFLLPRFALGFLEKRRILKIENQLLDMTILLSNSLRAGHSFVQALELVGRESPSPLAIEIQKVIKEMQVGASTEDALSNLSKRVSSKDLEMIVTGVLIQRQVGGNLAEILDTIAVTIERRIKSRAKIKALTAQGRISAWIVSLLPFGLAAFIFGKNPEYGKLLITDTLGQLMLGVGILALVGGIIWIKVVINVEV